MGKPQPVDTEVTWPYRPLAGPGHSVSFELWRDTHGRFFPRTSQAQRLFDRKMLDALNSFADKL